YRLFPGVFSLERYPGWPDTAAIDAAISASRAIVADGASYQIPQETLPDGESLITSMRVGTVGVFAAAGREGAQGSALRAVAEVERSPLLRAWRLDREKAKVGVDEICDLLSVTLEAAPDTIRKHIESLARLLEQAERPDLLEFARWIGRWCE